MLLQKDPTGLRKEITTLGASCNNQSVNLPRGLDDGDKREVSTLILVQFHTERSGFGSCTCGSVREAAGDPELDSIQLWRVDLDASIGRPGHCGRHRVRDGAALRSMAEGVLCEGRLGGIGEGRAQLAEAGTWLWIVMAVC